jgi:predicted GIY-YIG superfamily endonuclease
MKYVYLLRSNGYPSERYVGMTDDLNRRVLEHNAGGSPHTAKHRPWKAVVVVRFDDDTKAAAFEKYLKSGSGRTFAKRHFG